MNLESVLADAKRYGFFITFASHPEAKSVSAFFFKTVAINAWNIKQPIFDFYGHATIQGNGESAFAEAVDRELRRLVIARAMERDRC